MIRTTRRAASKVVDLNRRVHGGMVNLIAVPLFGRERWMVVVSRSVYGDPTIIIGRGVTAHEALADAERWVYQHAQVLGPLTGVVDVGPWFSPTPTNNQDTKQGDTQ